MTKLWVAPRVWEVGELNTDVKMQDYSNALEWLKDRPYGHDHVTAQAANFSQAVTGVGNFFAVDDSVFTINLTTAVANEKVLILFRGIWSSSGAIGSNMFWDVLIDDTNYGSSGTPTAYGSGFGPIISMVAASTNQNFMTYALVTIPTAGVHTLKLRAGGTNATTVAIAKTTTNTLDFTALDI